MELNSEEPRTNPERSRMKGLNPGLPDYKTSAPTTRSHCMPPQIWYPSLQEPGHPTMNCVLSCRVIAAQTHQTVRQKVQITVLRREPRQRIQNCLRIKPTRFFSWMTGNSWKVHLSIAHRKTSRMVALKSNILMLLS